MAKSTLTGAVDRINELSDQLSGSMSPELAIAMANANSQVAIADGLHRIAAALENMNRIAVTKPPPQRFS